MALLGIDLGTSSIKVMILDEQGQGLSVSKADYDVRSPLPGHSESDPEEWWLATVSAVRAVLAQVPRIDITALGLSGQMHGVVLTNVEGSPVLPALLWSDMRAQEELKRFRELPDVLLNGLANPLVPGMAGPLLCWLADHEPVFYQQARWALQPKDWLRFRLTGEAATDPSDASATLLYDIMADHWADDVILALGLKRALFPPIHASGEVAGKLSLAAAEALGLPAYLPVATGCADTAAAALGTGLLQPGPVQLTLGTGAQLIQLCAEPQADQARRTHLYRTAAGTGWYVMAAVQNAGLALDWVRQMLHATWEEIYGSAELEPVADDLFFLPCLTRERQHHPSPSSGGAFLGLRIDHRREHLLRASLEGIAFGLRLACEALPTANEATSLRLAGGGSEHPAWRQMLADILHRELFAVDTSAASVRGAALLAGMASGLWADALETVAIAPHVFSVATPDMERVELYNTKYQRYLACLSK